jgi:hypothetical protein
VDTVGVRRVRFIRLRKKLRNKVRLSMLLATRREVNNMAGPTPTKPALWSRAKAEAKKKFKVYPSAYANAWAAKWYKSKGGGWRGKDNRVKK